MQIYVSRTYRTYKYWCEIINMQIGLCVPLYFVSVLRGFSYWIIFLCPLPNDWITCFVLHDSLHLFQHENGSNFEPNSPFIQRSNQMKSSCCCRILNGFLSTQQIIPTPSHFATSHVALKYWLIRRTTALRFVAVNSDSIFWWWILMKIAVISVASLHWMPWARHTGWLARCCAILGTSDTSDDWLNGSIALLKGPMNFCLITEDLVLKINQRPFVLLISNYSQNIQHILALG